MDGGWFSNGFFYFCSKRVQGIGIYVRNRRHVGIFHINDFNTFNNKKGVRKNFQSLGKYFTRDIRSNCAMANALSGAKVLQINCTQDSIMQKHC